MPVDTWQPFGGPKDGCNTETDLICLVEGCNGGGVWNTEICFPKDWYNKAGAEIKKNASPPPTDIASGQWKTTTKTDGSGDVTDGCKTSEDCGTAPPPKDDEDDAASYFAVSAAITIISGVFIYV